MHPLAPVVLLVSVLAHNIYGLPMYLPVPWQGSVSSPQLSRWAEVTGSKAQDAMHYTETAFTSHLMPAAAADSQCSAYRPNAASSGSRAGAIIDDPTLEIMYIPSILDMSPLSKRGLGHEIKKAFQAWLARAPWRGGSKMLESASSPAPV